MTALNFPASPPIGQTYTVGSTTWTWDGVSWNGATGVIISGGILWRRVVTSGSQADVIFTGYPADASRLELRVIGRSTDTSGHDPVVSPGAAQIQVQFNGDTGPNYKYGLTNTNSGGVQASDGASGTTTGVAGVLANNNASNLSGDAGVANIDILSYANTTRYKHALGHYSYEAAANPTPFNTGYAGCVWLSSAAITSVRVFPELGDWADGSIVELWVWY